MRRPGELRDESRDREIDRLANRLEDEKHREPHQRPLTHLGVVFASQVVGALAQWVLYCRTNAGQLKRISDGGP